MHEEAARAPQVNLIRTSIYDKYSGSMKITTRLDHISHCRTASGTDWSSRWTCGRARGGGARTAGQSHFETLIIYKLSSRKFTTHNDLY